MFDDENKSLSTDLNGNQKHQTLPLISNDKNKRNRINIDSNFSTPDETVYEIMNDEESTKTTSTAAPGTPAARATN
jgi:hypothetical protein